MSLCRNKTKQILYLELLVIVFVDDRVRTFYFYDKSILRLMSAVALMTLTNRVFIDNI